MQVLDKAASRQSDVTVRTLRWPALTPLPPPPLQVLDEAASRQSDPTVLTLQLRNLSKEAGTGNKTDMVGRIEHVDENKERKVRSRAGGTVTLRAGQYLV